MQLHIINSLAARINQTKNCHNTSKSRKAKKFTNLQRFLARPPTYLYRPRKISCSSLFKDSSELPLSTQMLPSSQEGAGSDSDSKIMLFSYAACNSSAAACFATVSIAKSIPCSITTNIYIYIYILKRQKPKLMYWNDIRNVNSETFPLQQLPPKQARRRAGTRGCVYVFTCERGRNSRS
jgi:hypothetical protein